MEKERNCIKCGKDASNSPCDMCMDCELEIVEVRDEQGYIVESNEKKADTSSGDEHRQDE